MLRAHVVSRPQSSAWTSNRAVPQRQAVGIRGRLEERDLLRTTPVPRLAVGHKTLSSHVVELEIPAADARCEGAPSRHGVRRVEKRKTKHKRVQHRQGGRGIERSSAAGATGPVLCSAVATWRRYYRSALYETSAAAAAVALRSVRRGAYGKALLARGCLAQVALDSSLSTPRNWFARFIN